MTAMNDFYRDSFPSARIVKVLADPPGTPWQPDNPAGGWPFELTFSFRGREYCLRTQTGADGSFLVEDVPLNDGTDRSLGDLLAQGCPDFPWEGNDFPITIHELSRPGSRLSHIRVDNGCACQDILSVRGKAVVYRYRRIFPAARAVFTPDFFGVKGCSDQYAAPTETVCTTSGQPVPFSVEASFENDMSGQELLRLTAHMAGRVVCTRIPRTRFDAVGLLFSLPEGAAIRLTELVLNGCPLPDTDAGQCGHQVALLPEGHAPGNSPFELTGCITFFGSGCPGEGFSLSVELLPAPYARFVNSSSCGQKCSTPRLQVRARKQVQGGTLRAGQFEFVLEREGDCAVARGRNDAAGWVHFTFDPQIRLKPQGEWLIMRELALRHPPQGWKMDTTRYRVFVRPCDGTVIYQGPQGVLPCPPVFINRLRSTSSISGTVRTPTGRPIPGWRILLHREGDDECSPPIRSQLTDCRGRYSFDNLPRGRWRITAAPREGWQSVGCAQYTVTLGKEPVTGIDFVFEHSKPNCFEV